MAACFGHYMVVIRPCKQIKTKIAISKLVVSMIIINCFVIFGTQCDDQDTKKKKKLSLVSQNNAVTGNSRTVLHTLAYEKYMICYNLTNHRPDSHTDF